MALWARPVLAHHPEMENAEASGGAKDEGMGFAKSATVARAFWLGLIILGALTVRDDTPRHRPQHSDPGGVGAVSRVTRPATSMFVEQIARDRVWSTIHP